MKLKTLLAQTNLNRFTLSLRGPIKAVRFAIEEIKAKGYTHLAVEPDGTIFAWSGKDRPLAMLRKNDETLDGWFSYLSDKHGARDCSLGEMVGSMGYSPVNWHRMVWEIA